MSSYESSSSEVVRVVQLNAGRHNKRGRLPNMDYWFWQLGCGKHIHIRKDANYMSVTPASLTRTINADP